MLLLLSASALASDGDTLAGVTVGAPFSREGFECAAATCTKAGNVAGQAGQISVSLCENRAQSVTFMMRFVPFHFLATLGEDFVRSEAVLLNDPATISNAVSAIAGGLSAAGWRVLRKEESPARTMVFLGDSKNRLRTLTTIRDAMGLAQFTNGAKDSEDFMLLLQTADDPACTGGL